MKKNNLIVLGGSKKYWQTVRTLFGVNSVEYRPLYDNVGSATAIDLITGSGGTATDITFGATGIGDGKTAASFNGTSSLIDVYSAYLNTNFNKDEFSLSVYFKVAAAGTWTDGAARVVFRIYSDASNYIQVYRGTTNNEINFDFKFAGTLVNKKFLSVSPTGWVNIGVTCSKSNNRLRWYIDGTQRWADQVGFSSWANALLSTRCCLGSADVTVSLPWSGSLAHWVVANREASATEMEKLAYKQTKNKVVFFGDSVVNGVGASDANHAFRSLVSASKGWTAINAGINGTILQNTVQNTVTTIGAAAGNNGRDTYMTRVLPSLPNWVFILYGLNDIRLNDVAITSVNFENDLGEVVDALIANGVPPSQIVIGSPPHMSAYSDGAPIWNAGDTTKHAAYTASCAAVATAKATKYIDVYQYMLDNGGDTLLDVDGIHPNDAGHAAIATAFLSVL